MYKKDAIYICRKWDFIEKKGERTLVLWSDIPTWMVVDDELHSLLKMLDGKNTIGMIMSEFPKTLTEEQFGQILSFLTAMNVVYEKWNYKPVPEIKESKISEVVIHPTNRCNLNCIMCSNKYNQVQKKDEISTDKIKQFLDDTLEFAVEGVTLSIIGGEPLLKADVVLELARYAKKIGFAKVGISTNGTLMTKEFAKEAKKLDMEIQVSIDGTNEEENDYLRGKGTFKKIVRAIKILKDEDVFVVTNFLCHTGNYDSLEKYFKLALKLKVDSARFGPIKRVGGGKNEEVKNIPVDKLLRDSHVLFTKHPEFVKLLGKDYYSAFANSCRLKVKFGYCGTGLATLLLNPDGSIYPCPGHVLPEFKAGNILDDSFSNIWQHSPVLKKIRNTYPINKLNEKCSKCIVRHFCLGGCRAEAYHCTHSMTAPAIECENIKKAIIEMIWLLSTTPTLGTGKVYRFD